MQQNIEPQSPEDKSIRPERSEENARPASESPAETARCHCPPDCIGLPCCKGGA
jgi:hypothetical protein